MLAAKGTARLRLGRRNFGLWVLLIVIFTVSLLAMAHQPAISAASATSQEAAAKLDCMETGAEAREDCKAPMPPCPLHSETPVPGPLVMLPNGVCGMLVDTGADQKS